MARASLIVACSTLAVASFSLTESALALVTSTKSVSCSPTMLLQTAIDAVLPGTIATFNVSGTCTENIEIPSGKTIIIVGTFAGSGTKIVPKNTSLPAVSSKGDTTLQTLTVQNPSGVADSLVQAVRGGILQLIGVNLSAPKVDSVVGIWDGATGGISNSQIANGAGDAVDVSNGSSLVLDATPALASGPKGAKSVISGDVFCGPASSLLIRARTAGGKDGAVTISGANWAGVGTNQCSLNIKNKTSSVDNIAITANKGPGIGLNRSTLSLQGAKIFNNKGAGIDALQSSAQIAGSTFMGNQQADLTSGPGSSVFISGWDAKNSIPDAFSRNTLQCWPTEGGIVIDVAGLILPSGKSFGDLMSNNSCVTLLGYNPSSRAAGRSH